MDNFAVMAGTALQIDVALLDSRGEPITSYLGSETLLAEVWPGGDRPAAFAAAASWVDATLGSIVVTLSAAQTAPMAEGRYKGRLILTDTALGPLEAYLWTMDLRPAPGTGDPPKVYCDFTDLLEYGRSWLRNLQTDDDDEGFTRQCGRARSWLDELLIGAWPGSYGGTDLGSTLGWRQGQLPNPWLRQKLDAGGLIVRDLVKEICANKTLGFICQGQVGPGEKQQDYPRLARYYHREAAQLVRTLTAEIDSNGDGIPEIAINLGCGSMR